jgi:hypothetical protein
LVQEVTVSLKHRPSILAWIHTKQHNPSSGTGRGLLAAAGNQNYSQISITKNAHKKRGTRVQHNIEYFLFLYWILNIF